VQRKKLSCRMDTVVWLLSFQGNSIQNEHFLLCRQSPQWRDCDWSKSRPWTFIFAMISGGWFNCYLKCPVARCSIECQTEHAMGLWTSSVKLKDISWILQGKIHMAIYWWTFPSVWVNLESYESFPREEWQMIECCVFPLHLMFHRMRLFAWFYILKISGSVSPMRTRSWFIIWMRISYAISASQNASTFRVLLFVRRLAVLFYYLMTKSILAFDCRMRDSIRFS
jgi:hypothetical protein